MPKLRAPELVGSGGWLNSAVPLSIASLRGKVVLLHFWTASSVHCRRAHRELEELQARWPNTLAVIGVHSPKFAHEGDPEHLRRAVNECDIRYPVLDDPEMATWSQYGVKGWPTVVAIDPTSRIIGAITGEGNLAVLNELVADLVAKHRKQLNAFTIDLRATPMPTGVLALPGKVASDGAERLVIADTGHDRVLVTSLSGEILNIVEGLTRPQGVRFDQNRVLICDTGADRLLRHDLDTGETEVLLDDIAAPTDVIVDIDGGYVVAETARHRLWRLPPKSNKAGVIAGCGDANLIDARAEDAELAQPSGLTRLPRGIAFVDADTSALRVLTRDAKIATLVGVGLYEWGLVDGRTMRARLQHPQGVAATQGGRRIYVADTYNDRLRMWEGNKLRTLPYEDLCAPGGIDILPDGRLVVADTGNNRIIAVHPDRDEAWAIDVGGHHQPFLETEVLEGEPMRATRGFDIGVPFACDIEDDALDAASGAPVKVWIRAEPASLLGDCTTRFEADVATGRVPATGGAPGRGHLVVEVTADCLNSEGGLVTHRSILRHPFRVVRRKKAKDGSINVYPEWDDAEDDFDHDDFDSSGLDGLEAGEGANDAAVDGSETEDAEISAIANRESLDRSDQDLTDRAEDAKGSKSKARSTRSARAQRRGKARRDRGADNPAPTDAAQDQIEAKAKKGSKS